MNKIDFLKKQETSYYFWEISIIIQSLQCICSLIWSSCLFAFNVNEIQLITNMHQHHFTGLYLASDCAAFMRRLFDIIADLNSVQEYGRLKIIVSSLRTDTAVSLFLSSVQIFPIMLKTLSTEAFDTGMDSMCCSSLSKLGEFSFLKKQLHFSPVVPWTFSIYSVAF